MINATSSLKLLASRVKQFMVQSSRMDSTSQAQSDTPPKKSTGGQITTISVAGFVLLALGVIIFLYNQNQMLKTTLSDLQKVATPTQTPIATATPSADEPVVTTPAANSTVKSPLKVTGAVPAGWMFEGVFPIKLLDSEGILLAQAQASETVAGAWQSGKPVDFTATLTFKGATGSGTLVLENDNPSGNSANLQTFEVPVNFQ
jgi:hypothetical protein